ncbi:MAG: mechanosensitive ion channel [Parachlamydia sp.]|nr:mechanosensitive ion channel [Parachlamydia sp.]
MLFRCCLALMLFFCLRQSPVEAMGMPSFLDGFSLLQGHSEKVQLSVPDPYHLHPQWWQYYDVDDQELARRVADTITQMQALYAKLNQEDQQATLPLINSFNASLATLSEARKEQAKTLPSPKNISSKYTLDQQLQLHQQWRKLDLDTRKDQDDYEELVDRISKAHNNLDTLFAAYLRGDSQPTSARLMSGLEIMAQRAAVGIAEENKRLLQKEIESQQALLTKLENELSAARYAFDVSNYDDNRLEKDVQTAQAWFEKKQKEISRAEANAIGIRGSGLQERANKQLLAQKAITSSVEEASAWTSLAFHRLKFNLIMHVKQRFTIETSEMRERLHQWREHIQAVLSQRSKWEKQTLQELERIRHDQSLAEADTNVTRLNDTRRRTATETLALLQRLGEDIDSVQWLMSQFEHTLRANSNFLVRWWEDSWDSLDSMWLGLVRTLNISLFKVYDIPITLLTLLRVAMILLIAFIISHALRFGIQTFGSFKTATDKSAFYNICRLVHYFVLFLASIVILCTIGLDLNHILIVLGALTFGIGFGLQSVATNFLCGLRILFERKIKIGDYIELKTGHYGKVTEIHVQNTVICTSEGIEIVIPNSELLSEPLVNWTMNNDHRRLHIPFSTSYNNDKELIRRIVSEAAKQVPCTILDSAHGDPQVWLVKFGDHSLDFELAVWVNYKKKSFTESKEADYLWAIEGALRQHNIELPTPEQIMHVKSSQLAFGKS